ncbi:MAG: hypothetical protein JSW11_02405 [Candidatus Heimdallarchaeota archaeon]|nr:MAG: hypothetical protein JSW11_02405 [Candidatus Heimdallarchaeota archaeon]
MNEKIDIKKIEQQTFHEFMTDGITEILLGIVLIFMPLLFTIPVFVVFVPFLLFFGTPFIELIRERTTYPRLGRVEFKREAEREGYSVKKSLLEFLAFILGVFAIALTTMILIEGKFELTLIYKWLPFLFGLIMFGPSLYLVDKTGQQRYYILGTFSTLLGFFFSVIDFPDEKLGLYFYFFTLGVLAIILGIIRYIRFIQTYPVIQMEEEES